MAGLSVVCLLSAFLLFYRLSLLAAIGRLLGWSFVGERVKPTDGKTMDFKNDWISNFIFGKQSNAKTAKSTNGDE